MACCNIGGGELVGALRAQLAQHQHNYLFTVSMDHSPSEQLEDSIWHTSVLILSPAVEHAALARKIAAKLQRHGSQLLKWTRKGASYKTAVAKTFQAEFPNFPIYVFGISAKGSTIRQCESHYVSELGIAGIYHKTVNHSGKPKVLIGPLFRENNPQEINVELPENRALMVLHIAHFVRRMHLSMWQAVQDNGARPTAMNWDFFADKFPGARGDGMDLAFHALLSPSRALGRILWGYFVEGDKVETDLLADNLAGAIREMQTDPAIYPELRAVTPGHNGGLYYVEHWG